MSLTEAQRKAVLKKLDAVLADPEKTKREIREQVKREHPEMTEEQLDAGEGLLKAIFGI
jgi:hypothetical protein